MSLPFLDGSLDSASESGPRVRRFPLPSPGRGVPSCDRVAASRVSAPVAWVLTSPRHPLGSGESVVRPGGTRAARQAFPDAITGSGGSLGCSGPGPLLLGCSGPPVPSALGALAGRGGLTYPSWSAETYSLSGTWEISDGAKRAPPRAGLSGEQHGAEVSRRLGPASFRVDGSKRVPPRAGPSGEQLGAEVSRRLGPAYFHAKGLAL